MTIPEAVNTAVEGGYHLHGTDGVATVYTGASNEYSAWTRTDNHSSCYVNLQGKKKTLPLSDSSHRLLNYLLRLYSCL